MCALLLGACGGTDASGDESPRADTRADAVGQFDQDAAWHLIRLQLRYGQRPAGSPQLRKLADKLRARLPRGRFESVPGQPGLRNIVGVVPGDGPAIVIAAHYDTLATPPGFVGANNGAAGTAIVVQLARTLAAERRPADAPELRFVLFDGEEPAAGLPEQQSNFYRTGLRGSRAYVARHSEEVGAMILLDYVANRGLRLPREQSSSPGLWRQLRAAARQVGTERTFPRGVGPTITDDHTPFLRAGIPAVDLIDWSYPGHSLEDGLNRLSRTSVDAVGETVVALLQGRVMLNEAASGVTDR
jgi:hypothetical protein